MSLQPLSERIIHVRPSATVTITAKANELKAQGKAIIGLSAGEPDFDPPTAIQEAAVAAIHAGYHKYTAVDGLAELKAAIITKFKRDNKLDYATNQVIASTGAKQSIFNAMAVLLNHGDEVIIPAPYWVSYPEMTKLNDGIPVIIKTDVAHHYKFDSTGNVEVTCSALVASLNVSYVISLDTGNGGNFQPRRLSNGASTLNYNLYSDATRSTIWGDGTNSTSTVSDSYNLGLFTETRDYPVYGRVPGLQNVTTGNYSDTITVTVEY